MEKGAERAAVQAEVDSAAERTARALGTALETGMAGGDKRQEDDLRDLRRQLLELRSEVAEGRQMHRLGVEATAEARAMAEAAHAYASATAQALSEQNERAVEAVMAELAGMQASEGADVALQAAGGTGGGAATAGVEAPRLRQAEAIPRPSGEAGAEVCEGARSTEGATGGTRGQVRRQRRSPPRGDRKSVV